jgi:FeS assembly SUF system regulator
MFRLSKLTDYASVVMTELANAPHERRSAVELSGRIGLEPPTVAKVLKGLAKGNLVTSYRGAQGGYTLSRAPEAISMLDIIETMEGPLSVTECSVDQGLCAQEAICQVRSNWQRVNEAVARALAEITLKDMRQPLQASPMRLHLLPESRASVNSEV